MQSPLTKIATRPPRRLRKKSRLLPRYGEGHSRRHLRPDNSKNQEDGHAEDTRKNETREKDPQNNKVSEPQLTNLISSFMIDHIMDLMGIIDSDVCCLNNSFIVRSFCFNGKCKDPKTIVSSSNCLGSNNHDVLCFSEIVQARIVLIRWVPYWD